MSIPAFPKLLRASFAVLAAAVLFSGGPARAGDILGAVGAEEAAERMAEARAKIERLERQVSMESANYRQHYELANAYYDVGDLLQAEGRFRRVLELNPEYVQALVNLGIVLSDGGRNEEAVAEFEKALALDPEDCKARSNLGNTYYAMSRYPDAMYEYQRALEFDPDCYSALFNIAVAFADAGIFREAVRYWRRVDQVAPGTEAARQARENIELLEPFVSGPVPAPR